MKTITPEQLADELAAALPQHLKCVVLYGSAAAGDFVPGSSNLNLLVVVESLGIYQLDALSPPIVKWSHNGNPTPLFFTQRQLAESFNAYPIEFLDIEQSRRVLWGEDLLAEMRVDARLLRQQVQHELNGKLLKLRRRYLLTAGNSEAVNDLMQRSLSTFLVLFRAALRLYQQTVPDVKLDALHELARHIPVDVRPFERLFELKQKTGECRSNLPDVPFVSYLTAIEQVAEAINRHSQSEGRLS